MTTTMIASSDWFVFLLVDASLKAILLAVIAGAGVWLLRVRATSVRHRVWTAVLVGMLAMPLLVAWSPTVPLPTWAYPDFRSGQDQPLVIERVISAPVAPTIVAEQLQLHEPAEAVTSVAPAPTLSAVEHLSGPSAVELPARRWTDPGSSLLVACYAVGVVFFGVRLLVGLVAAYRLVRTARPVELPPQHEAGLAQIRVLESSRVRVPLTVGWLRPTIVLPGDWSSWDAAMLAAVLAHERAHVRRGDLWVALAAQVNRAIYWFHPLSWFLARRLTALAEEACDDAVIESLGDRTGYARHLLTIASRLTGQPRRLQPIGVSMAARPAVEHRIEAILDTSRPLARRLTFASALALAVIAAPLAMLAAGLRADESPTETHNVLHGRVVMESNGKPVENADVRLVTWNKDRTHYDTQRTRSDAKGEFAIEKVPPGENELAAFFDVFASRKSLYKGEPVRPKADGSYAPAILKLAKMPEIDVHVVDKATSKPIAGANVGLVWCDTERDHKTNDQGESTLQRLTHEVWHVEVKAPGYAQEVQAINLAEADKAHVSFELVPGGKVFGTVRDEAGTPIAGAGISVFPADFRGGQIEYLETDTAGKYEFGNLPVDVGMVFMVSHDGFLETRRADQCFNPWNL